MTSAQFSPDGTNIVSASGTRLCACGAWRQECVQTLEGHSSGCFLQFSPDGTNIVSASWDQTVRVWSVATGECAEIGGTAIGESAQFSPMARISYRPVTTRLCVWSVATGECVQRLEGTAVRCFRAV